MSDRPYTGEDQIIIANMIGGYDAATLVLAYLAGQYRLLPPGGARVEHFRVVGDPGHGYPDYTHDWGADEEGAREWMAQPWRASWTAGPTLQRRTVTTFPDGSVLTGPFVEVPDGN